MKKLLVIVCLSIASVVYAWHKDVPPGGKVKYETTETIVTKQQANQKLQGEVPEKNIDPKNSAATPISSESAEKNITEASKQLTEEQAASVIIAAGKQIEHQEKASKVGTFIWGGVFLLAGVGIVLWLKRWANKNLPEMPQPKRTRW